MSILESRPETADSPPQPPRGSGASPLRKALGFARLLSRPRVSRKLGTLVTEGYLARSGWVRSVSRDGLDLEQPLPWATYPFIEFIGLRLRRELRVFEYGAGSSTLYYAQRVRSVVAVEHDAAFAQVLSPHLPANARLIVEPAYSDAYVHAIDGAGEPFDLVAVDGRDRVRCAEAAMPRLSGDGVLVLDDAERPEYQPAISRLTDAGFRRLDFWGLAPGVVDGKSTTVFYRPGNVLGI